MTAEQLEELLGKCSDPKCDTCGRNDVLLETLARRVLSAEKLVEVLREISSCGQSEQPDHWKFRVMAREKAQAALTAYREASK